MTEPGWDDKVTDLLGKAYRIVYQEGDAKRALRLVEEASAILEDQVESE